MATCATKRFKKTKICSGDLNDRIEILTRVLGTPGPEDTVPPITLDVLKATWCGITTRSGTPRFDGVNVNDIATHIFTVRSNPSLMLLEEGNNFIRLTKGGISRLFRVLSAKINDEQDIFIDISATERGIDSDLATLA